MGDGEISGTGVEIGGFGVIKVDVIKGKSGDGRSPRRPMRFYTHGTVDRGPG